MADPTEEQLAQADEALDVLRRCNAEKPSAADIEALRKHLKVFPTLWMTCGDLAANMSHAVIEGMKASAAIKESIRVGREAMRRDLGYDKSPLLEQMLIDHLLLCWLRLQLAEHTYTYLIAEGGSLNQALFWEKRLSAVQRRYLRAVEALARIRKLALPAIQVNIGDKQVNVAGG
ncbi:MAG: hypothetical protein KKI08_04220 [Armatimonadetes bacterium]|nr:hypothetical protein [Armatimonadota bacterium]